VLAVAAALRLVVAVHRGDREELHGLRLALHAVLEIRPADRRGAFGPERELAAAPVLEDVHLLLHDVGAGARRPLEEVHVLEHRRLDAPVPVEVAQSLHLLRHLPPERLLGGKNVVRTARRLDARHARSSREERVAFKLVAERRLRAVAGVDNGVRRIAVDEGAHGGDERVPVGARQVDAPDGAREEQVAAEQRPVRVVRDVRRGVSGDGDALEREPADVDRLAALEQVVGHVGAGPACPPARTRRSVRAWSRSPSGM